MRPLHDAQLREFNGGTSSPEPDPTNWLADYFDPKKIGQTVFNPNFPQDGGS